MIELRIIAIEYAPYNLFPKVNIGKPKKREGKIMDEM